MVKGWKRNPKEGESNRPIEQKQKVEYAWRQRKKDSPGDYLSVVKDKSKGGYYINYSLGGSRNQTRLGHYSNKEKARKDAVTVAEKVNKGATLAEIKSSVRGR